MPVYYNNCVECWLQIKLLYTHKLLEHKKIGLYKTLIKLSWFTNFVIIYVNKNNVDQQPYPEKQNASISRKKNNCTKHCASLVLIQIYV